MSVILLRHGTTVLNAEKKTEDRIRSWLDTPMSPEGVRVARFAAKRLAHVPIDHIYSSDLQRAIQTADFWRDTTGAPVSIHPELRPWDLGNLAGMHSLEAKPLMDDLIQYPDTPAPGGESFNRFIERFIPFILPLVADIQLHGVVSHSRNLSALQAWLASGQTGIHVPTWNATAQVQPGQAAYFCPKDLVSRPKEVTRA